MHMHVYPDGQLVVMEHEVQTQRDEGEDTMDTLEARVPLRPGCAPANRLQASLRAQTPTSVGFKAHAAETPRRVSTETLSAPVSTQTKPHASVAQYVIGLSQTDTVEQAEWMQAMNTRSAHMRTLPVTTVSKDNTTMGKRTTSDASLTQADEGMKVIEDYKRAIEHSDEHLLREVFAPQVHIEIPAGAIVDQSANTASHVMSQVAKTAPGIEAVLTADAGNDWYLLGFEGQLEGQKLQAVDQVHLNGDGKIDQLIIYMRPIPAAQKFAEAISQRLQPTA